MSKYRKVHQCVNCKKVYSENRFWTKIFYNDNICTKCGTRGCFVAKIGKRKLLGWKFSKEDKRYVNS